MKVITTFSIDPEILDKFRELAKREAMSMSQFVENKMVERLNQQSFVDDNGATDIESFKKYYPNKRKGEILRNETQ